MYNKGKNKWIAYYCTLLHINLVYNVIVEDYTKSVFHTFTGPKNPVGLIADVEDNTQVTILGGFNIILCSMSSI